MNVSAKNVNEVISNLTSIITTANETSDQNSDNLRVISDVLTQSVNILTQNVSLEVANQVIIEFLLNACFQIFFKVTANTVEILDNVEEWPMEILQQQSNR